MNDITKLKEVYLSTHIPQEFDKLVKSLLYTKKTKYKKLKISTGISLLLVLGLNTIPAVAETLREVPLLRPIVDVLTLNRFVAASSDGQITLDITVPTLDGAGEIGELLNEKYLALAEEEYQRFIKNLPNEESGITWHEAVIGDYEILWQDQQLVVIRNWMSYLAGSGTTVVKYDVVDLENQLILNLPTLFKDDSYVQIISQEIIRQMREQMKVPNGNFYWIDPADSPGGEIFTQIDPMQSFYINEERKLVVVFGEYEVAPGYVGTPEFVIDYEIIRQNLVSDRYLK
jgi:hypothetical protein